MIPVDQASECVKNEDGFYDEDSYVSEEIDEIEESEESASRRQLAEEGCKVGVIEDGIKCGTVEQFGCDGETVAFFAEYDG